MTTGAQAQSGIILRTPAGEEVRVVLMDEDEEYLNMTANPDNGVYGYENRDTRLTLFLEDPDANTSEDARGIVLQTPDRDPVRVVLMDEDDEYLDLAVNPDDGVYGYENTGSRVTLFLEEP